MVHHILDHFIAKAGDTEMLGTRQSSVNIDGQGWLVVGQMSAINEMASRGKGA